MGRFLSSATEPNLFLLHPKFQQETSTVASREYDLHRNKFGLSKMVHILDVRKLRCRFDWTFVRRVKKLDNSEVMHLSSPVSLPWSHPLPRALLTPTTIWRHEVCHVICRPEVVNARAQDQSIDRRACAASIDTMPRIYGTNKALSGTLPWSVKWQIP